MSPDSSGAWKIGLDPEVTNGDSDCTRLRVAAIVLDHLWRRIALPEGGPLKTATAKSELIPTSAAALERACLAARVAADNKARQIVVLDMRGITPLYDYFVLATGSSRRQIHALAEEIDAALQAVGDRRLHIEGYEASKWVVQDYGDVVVHVFDPDSRSYYSLEDLWADAPRVTWENH